MAFADDCDHDAFDGMADRESSPEAVNRSEKAPI